MPETRSAAEIAADAAAAAQKEADSQRMREDAKHTVDDLTSRPWTQSQPRNPKTTMEINMFLREIAAANDGLCIRATAYIADDNARALQHAQYMLITDVTHPHRVLNSGPPQLDDIAVHAVSFPAAGALRTNIERIDAKMCNMILKAILAHIASNLTKLKG